MELDIKYLTTVPGVLKIAQWVFSILVEICRGWGSYNSWARLISFTAGSAWLSVTPLLVIHALRLYKLSPFCANIHWVLTDLIQVGIFSVLYAISAVVALPLLFDSFNTAANILTIIFIWLALAAFAYHAHFSWAQFKAGETGRVVLEQNATTEESPRDNVVVGSQTQKQTEPVY